MIFTQFTDENGKEFTYPLPDKMLGCPGCGKHYHKCDKICFDCEECDKCCLCDEPDFLPSEDMINYVLESSQ